MVAPAPSSALAGHSVDQAAEHILEPHTEREQFGTKPARACARAKQNWCTRVPRGSPLLPKTRSADTDEPVAAQCEQQAQRFTAGQGREIDGFFHRESAVDARE